ncbi:hypothetical protein ACWKWU_19155 [Chitinophaga lutea]
MNTAFITAQGYEVLVFRTNIRFRKDMQLIASWLDGEKSIHRWSVDREDADKVLRIEARELPASQVIAAIRDAGFDCEEL